MLGEQRLSDPSGQVIADRYELVGLIGRGGYGVVCRGVDRLTGEAVAIKMLNDVAARDPQHVERLKREQQALTALAGTNAVRLLDLCASPSGRLCLVMELLVGVDLEQRLEQLESRGEPMSFAELLAVLEPIVETMERAHAAGILHRDLKPANIFLVAPEAGGGVRLLDFGLARLRRASPLTAAGTVLGSPSYIAPEVWKGRTSELDQRVDVYSLGVIVFRALTGKLPFEGESLKSKFILTTTAPRPSVVELRAELPAKVDAWIQQVLAIEPDERFDGVRAAYNSLSVALTGRAGALATEQSAPGSGKPDRERGTLASAWRKATSIVKRLVQREEAEREVPWDPDPEAASPEPPPAPATPAQRADPERSMVTEWLAQSELDFDRGWDEAGESTASDKRPSHARPPVTEPPRAVERARIISIGAAEEESSAPNRARGATPDEPKIVKTRATDKKPAQLRSSKAKRSAAAKKRAGSKPTPRPSAKQRAKTRSKRRK